jgi:hypothetical protein
MIYIQQIAEKDEVYFFCPGTSLTMRAGKVPVTSTKPKLLAAVLS